MFYKRKMKRLAAENVADFKKIIEGYQQEIAAAKTLSNPNDKYLELHRISEAAEQSKFDATHKIYQQTCDATRLNNHVGLDILSKKEEQILKDSKNDFYLHLDVTIITAEMEKRALIDTRLTEMSEAPHFETLCEKCPNVGVDFAKATVKEAQERARATVLVVKAKPQGAA